ncbi:MAG: SdpI family protein [Bacteroidota bacterium]
MKQTSPLGILLIALIICLPLIYTAIIYPELPYTIPLHFNINGKADRFGSKDEIWFVTVLLAVVSAGVYLLIRNLGKIDPKKTAGQSPELYHKIATTIVIFLSAINLVIVYATKAGSINIANLLLPLLGLFFTVLGNYMHSIKPNYFIGFRTPWALENEDNWRKTHQLVGKVWVPGGLLITLATLVFPAKIGFVVFMSIIVLMVAIPAIFSYQYFKKNQ